LHIVAG